jgi:outer membrane protein insertion porin family
MPGMADNTARTGRSSWVRIPAALVVLAILSLILGHRATQAQAPPPPTPAKSGREVIVEVKVIGNRNIPTEKIMRYIHTRPGMEYNPSTLYDDITRLIESRMFKSARPREERTKGGVIVFFDVTEYPNLVQEVIFKNAHHISAKELEGMARIHKGMPLDTTSNKAACFEIQDYLKKKGRYWANVVLEEGDKETDKRVVFNVTEGPIVRVRSTNFVGNQTLAGSDRLRTQIETSRAFLGLGGTFNQALIDADVNKLEEYYQANGYRNAKVNRELIFSPDQSQVDVIYHIVEDKRYRVKDWSIEGAKGSFGNEVSSIVMLKRQDYYSEGVASADVRNITDYYGWRGYPVTVQKEVFDVPGEPGVVRVQYEVKEKPPAKVGRIFVVGNDVTQERVILRLLGIYPGQTLRYPEMRIAEANLARANIFEMKAEDGIKPTVKVLNPDDDSEYKDILVELKETHTGSLMFGAGVNSSSGVMGSIVLNERNFDITRIPTSWADWSEGRAFRGAGQEFRVEAVPGTQVQRYTVSFREPFLFDRPYSMSDSFYYYQRLYTEDTETRLGGRINFAHQLDRYWSINTGVRLETVGIGNIAYGAPVDYTSVEGQNFVVGPSIGLTFDARDSFMRPTQGGMVNASIEQDFGAFTYPLFNMTASAFFTTYQRTDGSGKQVLAMRSTLGYAGPNTPVYDRFYAGGYNSMRGFQFRGVGPQGNGYEIGGDFMWLNSIEYQVPIQANDHLWAVAFCDSGTVEEKIEIKNYRVAVGVGLRIVVPMLGPVPIALDFGFPVSAASWDHKQIFQFSLGMFR